MMHILTRIYKVEMLADAFNFLIFIIYIKFIHWPLYLEMKMKNSIKRDIIAPIESTEIIDRNYIIYR